MSDKISIADELVSFAMQELADAIDNSLQEITGDKMGFSLIVFNSEAGSRMNYVSNCNREDVTNAMKSLLYGWENGLPDVPAHEVKNKTHIKLVEDDDG